MIPFSWYGREQSVKSPYLPLQGDMVYVAVALAEPMPGGGRRPLVELYV